MILTTIPNMGGRDYQVLGMVTGSMVQSKNAFKDIGAGFKSMIGGELHSYTEMMQEARHAATMRMIDQAEQGRGYGREALDKVIEYIMTKPFGDSDRVALTCNKRNCAARKLYENRGFSVTGSEDEDEIELAMTV